MKRRQTGSGSTFGADPGVGVCRDAAGDLALGDAEHVGCDPVEDVDCIRDRHPNGEPVRERAGAVALDGRPASKLSAITGASDATTPTRSVSRERASTARPIPPSSAPLPVGTHGRGRLLQLVEELVADRGVAVELGRLGAVLEERDASPLGFRAGELLGLVHVRAFAAQLRAQRLDPGELGRARLFGDEDERREAELLRGPRGRGAVVPGRGRDDLGRPAAWYSRRTGSAPRHLNAPSSCVSSRFRYRRRLPASAGGAGSSAVATRRS